MIKFFKNIIFLIFCIYFLSGCQSLKDGLEGKKKSKNAEEFLINKKNTLVLPPDYSEFPTPANEIEKKEEFDLKKILKKGNDNDNDETTNDQTISSVEKLIIEEIKKD